MKSNETRRVEEFVAMGEGTLDGERVGEARGEEGDIFRLGEGALGESSLGLRVGADESMELGDSTKGEGTL